MRVIDRTRTAVPPTQAGRPDRTRRAVSRRSIALGCLAAVLLSVLGSDVAYAQAASVSEVLGNIQGWLMAILASLATVFLMIGGTRYVMAGGDPSEVEKAKTAFKAAGIGYLLAVLAPIVVSVLKTFAGL